MERQEATRQKVTYVARGRFDPNKVSSRNFVNPPLEAHARKQGCKKERWSVQRKLRKPGRLSFFSKFISGDLITRKCFEQEILEILVLKGKSLLCAR